MKKILFTLAGACLLSGTIFAESKMTFIKSGTMFGDSVSDLSTHLPKSYVGLPFEFFYSGGRDLNARIDEWLKESGL